VDPANAKFVCGAECGIASVGTTSAGTEHWSAIVGTPTVVTSGPTTMRSTRAFNFTTGTLRHTFATAIASPGTLVARFYVYFPTLPSGSTLIFRDFGLSNLGVYFQSSDSKIYARNSAGTLGATGVTVTTGQWYRIDVKYVRAVAQTVDVQVGGVACGQATNTVADSAISGFEFGIATGVADMYVDDLIVTGTSSEYPIGEGTVVGLYPNADRTNSAATPTDGNAGHLFSATTDFGKGAGGATATGNQNAESTSWQSLANPLSTSIGTNFVSDLLGASTEHVCWEFADLPSAAVSINGVMLVVATHSASTTGNNASFRLRGSNGNTGAGGQIGGDFSEATITVPVSIVTTDHTGATWTPEVLNASHLNFGDSSDVNPDPYCDGMCVETDIVLRPRQLVMVEPSLAASQAGRI
jgi:hypothetical protein